MPSLDRQYDLGVAGYNPFTQHEQQLMHVEYGSMPYFDRETHEFLVSGASVLPNELGGLVYVALDGMPHTAGILNDTNAGEPDYNETEATALDINYVLDRFREMGFKFFPEEEVSEPVPDGEGVSESPIVE